jgi:hypothetical protein
MDSELEQLKKRLDRLERALKVGSDRIEVTVPITFRYPVNLMGATLLAGESSPESRVTAAVGALYLRRNGGSGTTLYIKESGTGSTGWSTTA